MDVYYEVINGTIYVCNRHHNVKHPVAARVTGLSAEQLDEMCATMNATYKAGFQTAMNKVRALVDQMEVSSNVQAKRDAN